MSRLLETLCLENGQVHLLPYHAARMQRSRRELWGLNTPLDIQAALLPLLKDYQKGLYKCRVLYGREIDDINFIPYQRPQIRSLKKVYSEHIEYAHKYEERTALHMLYQQKGSCDDILIIKNGWVTDTYIGNLLLFDGQQWWTPDQPLLQGVQRQYLLDQGRIQTAAIRETDLPGFQAFKFINALNPFKTSAAVPIAGIQ
ncbi:MAG: aminotransferase class IV [Cyclobacteriaceae bacterium]